MQKKKLTVILSLVLIMTMLIGNVSVMAVGDVTTTAPTTTHVHLETTTAAPDTEYSDDYWNGYYDGYEDGLKEDYDDGYEDGYYDGSWEGYDDGYYQGYYDGVNDAKDPTVFERWDNFVSELRYRIEMFFYRIRNFFEKLFKTGAYEEIEIADPGKDFIPDGSQKTLADDADAALLCEEFNTLINGFMEIKETVTVTKTEDVGVEAKDVPAVVESIVNSVIENFTGTTTSVQTYEAGDYAGRVQSTYLYPAGLTSAKKTVNEDGTTDYEFVLIEEAAFYNGAETYGVKLVDGNVAATGLQHDECCDTVYIEAADLGPATVTSAEIYYPGATITAKTDAQGRLIKYDVNMPVEGQGTGKVGPISVTISVEGYRNEGFVMAYAQ